MSLASRIDHRAMRELQTILPTRLLLVQTPDGVEARCEGQKGKETNGGEDGGGEDRDARGVGRLQDGAVGLRLRVCGR